MEFKNSLVFAQQLDAEDPLREYRDEFHFPKVKGKDVIYFTGNSWDYSLNAPKSL